MTNKITQRIKKTALTVAMGTILLFSGNYSQAAPSQLPIDRRPVEIQTEETKEVKRKEANLIFNESIRNGMLSYSTQRQIYNNFKYIVDNNGKLDEKETNLYHLVDKSTGNWLECVVAKVELERNLKDDGLGI